MKNILYYLTTLCLLVNCSTDDNLTVINKSTVHFVLKVKNNNKVQNNEASTNSFDNSYILLKYEYLGQQGIKSDIIKNDTLKINEEGISVGLKLIPGNYLISTFEVYKKQEGESDDLLIFNTLEPIYFNIKSNESTDIVIYVIPADISVFTSRKKEYLLEEGDLAFEIKGLTLKWFLFQIGVGYKGHYIGDYILTVKRGTEEIASITYDTFEDGSFATRNVSIIYDTIKKDDFKIFVSHKEGDKIISGTDTLKYTDLEDKIDNYGKHYDIYPKLIFIVLE